MAVEEKFIKKRNITISGGGNYSSKAFLLADVFRKTKNLLPNLWIVNDKTEQENVAHACENWFSGSVWKLEMFENEHLDRETAAKNRIAVLEAAKIFIEEEPKIVVATYVSLMQPAPTEKDMRERAVSIKTGQETRVVDVFEELISIGYEVAEDQYLEKGQYY